MDPLAKDLIDKLLQVEPTSRLGLGSIDELKQHPFFKETPFPSIFVKGPPEFKRILSSSSGNSSPPTSETPELRGFEFVEGVDFRRRLSNY